MFRDKFIDNNYCRIGSAYRNFKQTPDNVYIFDRRSVIVIFLRFFPPHTTRKWNRDWGAPIAPPHCLRLVAIRRQVLRPPRLRALITSALKNALTRLRFICA